MFAADKHKQMISALVKASALACAVSLAACSATTTTGNPDDPDQAKGKGTSETASTGPVWQSGGESQVDYVKVPISVKEGKRQTLVDDYGGGFNLTTAATKYTITISGCLTGYSKTVTESSGGTLKLVKSDKNCLAKLTSFFLGVVEYTPLPAPDPDTRTDAEKFNDWKSGDVAIFVNGDGDKLSVHVVSQISVTVQADTDTVAYTFNGIQVGTQANVLEGQYSAGHPISVNSIDAPEYAISALDWVGLTAGGGGKFTFELQCPITTVDSKCATTTDDPYQAIEGTRYLLVELADGKKCADLTAPVATSMFESGAPISVAVGDVMASVADPLFKGGFTTKTDANVLTGPDQMYLHPDLQLLIQSLAVDGGGIRCFNIKLDAITQP